MPLHGTLHAQTVDTASLPTALPAGQFEPCLCNTQKVLLVQQADLERTKDAVSVSPATDTSHAKSTAYATNLVAKAAAGSVFSIFGYNSKASAQFIQLHDAASLPADTSVPIAIFTVAASSNFNFDLGDVAIPCSTGIVVCNSSTGPTKTIGSADCWFNVLYV